MPMGLQQRRDMAGEKSRHGGDKSNEIDRKNISNYYRKCKLAIGNG